MHTHLFPISFSNKPYFSSTAAIAFVRTVQHVGQKGFNKGLPGDIWACIALNKLLFFGENLISWLSSITKSRAPRIHRDCLANSCNQRFVLWTRQWTKIAFGSHCWRRAATPRIWPLILEAPSYAWPWHWLTGNADQIKLSRITLANGAEFYLP